MSLLNYYVRINDPFVMIATAQPVNTTIIGPAALTPSVEDFRLTYCIAMLTPPSKHLMESAAQAVAGLNSYIEMRGQ